MLVENSTTEAASAATSLDESSAGENEAAQLSQRRRRFRRRMVLLFVLGLVFVPYLFTRATAPITRITSLRVADVPISPPIDKARPLKVVVYNIAHGRGVALKNWDEGGTPKTDRVIQIGQFLKTLDADVVVLNEVDFNASWSGGVNQAELIAEQAGFPYLVCQSNMDFGFIVGRLKFGNAVLSKYPIQKLKLIDLPAHKSWEEWLVGCKKGVLCTIQLNQKTQVDIAAVHLEYRGEDTRNEGSTYLADFLATESSNPLIIAGDLNTTPATAPYANKTRDGLNAFDELIKAMSMTHLPKVVTDEMLTFPSWKPVTAIDWILFRDTQFEGGSYEVIDSDLSDHLPVSVELRLKR